MENQTLGGENGLVKIAEVLATLKGRKIPLISQESSVEEAIQTISRFPHSRLLYVIDDDGKLTGILSLENLVRHFFPRSHEPQVHPRQLISMITTETAKDIMERHPIFASEEESVDLVLKRMIGKNVKEIAVLDKEKRPIGDVTMIDLLNFLINGH